MPWDGLRAEIVAEFAAHAADPEHVLRDGLESFAVRAASRVGARVGIRTCTYPGCSERRRSGRGERHCERHRGARAEPRAKSKTRATCVRSTCISCRMPIIAPVFHFKCAFCR